jgi:hypothetical protein
MAGRGIGPDFVEALARGLDVLSCFDERHPQMTLTQIAVAADLARPTARRLVLTLQELGYIRAEGGSFALTPQVLRLGTSYVSALGLWQIARPHLEDLVGQTHESSGLGPEDHHPAGRDRHPVPGAADLAGQGPAGRPGPGRAGGRAGPAQPVRTADLPAPPRRPGGGRDAAGPGPRLGAR